MRKKKKELTFLSLSALDLFCSAMGVFMILCFIVFPYYTKASPEPETLPKQEPPKPPVRKAPAVCVAMHWEMKLRDTMGYTMWSGTTCNDLNLVIEEHPKDGKRATYTYNKRNHPGSPAEYMVDAQRGGGELWVHPAITPGRYIVGFNIHDKTSPAAMHLSGKRGGADFYRVIAHRVCYTVLTPSGKTTFNSQSMTDSEFNASPHVYKEAEIIVDENGDVTVREL